MGQGMGGLIMTPESVFSVLNKYIKQSRPFGGFKPGLDQQ